MTPSQASDFVSEVRDTARKMLAVKDKATSLTDKYASLNVSTDLNQDHFAGENDGILLADFNAAVAVLGTINTQLKAGTPSNMTKLIKIS